MISPFSNAPAADAAGGSRSCATKHNTPAADAAGGSRSCATECDTPAADAAGGSRSCATEYNTPAADAQERVPPVRHHPSRNSVMTYHDNRSVILYVTVVTEKRNPILSSEAAHNCIVDAWKTATNWLVGWYVIMPDHIHFFCAPATYPPSDFHRWMAYWKSLAAKAYWLAAGGSRSCATEHNTPAANATGGSRSCATECDSPAADAAGGSRSCATESDTPAADAAGGSRSCATECSTPPADAQERVPPARNPPLFQRDCWDRQLRTGESYAQKWEYVRNNPVRKGLVANACDWPYTGRMNILEWHERI